MRAFRAFLKSKPIIPKSTERQINHTVARSRYATAGVVVGALTGALTGVMAFSTGVKAEQKLHDEFEERKRKCEQYGNIAMDDTIRNMFIHSSATDDEIIEFLKKNNVDVNKYVTSTVYGVFMPIFFWTVYCGHFRQKVLDYMLDNKLIDPSLTVDLSTKNINYFDILEICPAEYVPKLIEYGFKLHYKKDEYRHFLNFLNIDRLGVLIQNGLIDMEDIKPYLTEELLKTEIRHLSERNWIDYFKSGANLVEICNNERKISALLLYYKVNHIKIKNDELRKSLVDYDLVLPLPIFANAGKLFDSLSNDSV